MHFIRQLFEGKPEEWVHALFTRYGRGDYAGPAFEADIGKAIKFKATVEYCSAFVRLAALSGGSLDVEGAIYAKSDFRNVLDGLGVEYDDKSKPKKGIYVAQVKGELDSEVLVKVCEGAASAIILLNLTGSNSKLKCKKKPPKPGGERELDFCSGQVDLSVLPKLKEDLLFDVSEFKSVKVDNRFIIEELVIPQGLSPGEARLQAKRKGILSRTVTVDGKERKSDCPLLV